MKACVVALATIICAIQPARAADLLPVPAGQPAPAAGRPGWALQVTSYLWASGLSGNISPFRRGPTLSVDKSFSDVMENFNIGGFANVWARSGRFVFSGDVMYVDTTDAHGVGPLPALQIPELGVTLPPGASVRARVDSKEFMTTLQGGYRVVDAKGFTLDALAGARFWYIDNRVRVFASAPPFGSVSASHGESFGWVDPVIGLRAFVPVTGGFSLQAQADVGGFGAGSDITWSALATVNYAFTDHLSASAGYKVLYVDYRRGGHVFDNRLAGPVLGMTYRF